MKQSLQEVKFLIFVLEYDNSNSIYSNIPKVCNFFFNKNANIRVEATRVNFPLQPKPNYVVHEYGGGSVPRRIRAAWRLLKLICGLSKNELTNLRVFHYMNHKTAVFPGLLLRMLGAYQVLWYAHASGTLSLRLSTRIVDHIFTSADNAFPFKSKKISTIGQIVDVKDFPLFSGPEESIINGIVSVGRIASAKKLEAVIELVSKLSGSIEQLCLIGPITEIAYYDKLMDLAATLDVTIQFLGEIPNYNLHKFMSKYKYYFNGTESAVDKAVIEAALVGCLILTENKNALSLTGMDSFWQEKLGNSGPEIMDQAQFLASMTSKEVKELRVRISQVANLNNNLENNLEIIYSHLMLGNSRIVR